MEFSTEMYKKIIETHENVKHIRETMEEFETNICDHEDRIRVLENRSAAWEGRDGAILVGVPLIITVLTFLFLLFGYGGLP